MLPLILLASLTQVAPTGSPLPSSQPFFAPSFGPSKQVVQPQPQAEVPEVIKATFDGRVLTFGMKGHPKDLIAGIATPNAPMINPVYPYLDGGFVRTEVTHRDQAGLHSMSIAIKSGKLPEQVVLVNGNIRRVIRLNFDKTKRAKGDISFHSDAPTLLSPIDLKARSSFAKGN